MSDPPSSVSSKHLGASFAPMEVNSLRQHMRAVPPRSAGPRTGRNRAE
ncbi:hypothetical protein [Actinoplanes sp. RD1]|nr:hypothetical protein [Actinoplanes sp. RD1]